jgi:NHL repeat-containing protein
MRRIATCLCCLLAAASAAAATVEAPLDVRKPGDVKFVVKPVVTRAGGQTKITFEVSATTDVEVAILDAKDKVVRHLAAGVLGGKKVPPAPLKKGFAQALAWDMRDDFGKPAKGGPFKVRVRTGMKMKLGRIFGGDLYNFGQIESLTTDEDGNLFVEANKASSQGVNTVRVYNPDGSYQRTLLPFPADLEPGSMKDVARWDPDNKSWYTRNLSDLDPEYYYAPSAKHPNHYTLLSASKKNGVCFVSSKYLHFLDYRGRVKGANFKGVPFWHKKWDNKWHNPPTGAKSPLSVAISPDGKYAYMTGPYSKGGKPRTGSWKAPYNFCPPGGVWRMKLANPENGMELFVTVPVKMKGDWMRGGRDAGQAIGPTHGITVDKQGRVYVCDRDNNQVVIYDESAKRLGAISVDKPDRVKVHPETGAIYVLTRVRVKYLRHKIAIVKFADFKEGAKPVVSYPVPTEKGCRKADIALSPLKEKTLIWVSGVKGKVACLEDKGDRFVVQKTKFKHDPKAQVSFSRIAVNYTTDDVYVSDGKSLIWHYDGDTGKGEMMAKNGAPFRAVDLSVGYDGNLCVRTGDSFSGPLERLDRNLKPIPYATGTHVLSPYISGRFGTGFCEKGIGCGPDGSVYSMSMYGWQRYLVLGFGRDGKPKNGPYLANKIPEAYYKKGTPRTQKSAVLGPVPAANGGLRVDLKGNFYVGLHVLPKDVPPPKAFAKDKLYTKLTGSVVKFTAKGGAVHGLPDYEKAGPDLGVLETSKGKIDGAVTIYPGISPISGTMKGCVCRVSRFDLDRYGRLGLPSAMSSSITIVDNSGNKILTFGRYGNYDSQYIPPDSEPQKPVVAVPAIPMSWPTGVGFSEKAVYVCDTGNRRVVRADITYDTKVIIDVKWYD